MAETGSIILAIDTSTEGTQNTEEIASSRIISEAELEAMTLIDGVYFQIEPDAVCAKFTNMRAIKSAVFIALSSIQEMTKNPQEVKKEDAYALAPQLSGMKRKAEVLTHNAMTLCWIDIDEGNRTLTNLKGALLALGLESFIIYSSYSATTTQKKWRVVVELNKPTPIKDWLILQNSFASLLGADVAACRPNQIFFAPNKGKYYKSHINEGKALDYTNLSLTLTLKILETEL